jgi:hypothetical protein
MCPAYFFFFFFFFAIVGLKLVVSFIFLHKTHVDKTPTAKQDQFPMRAQCAQVLTQQRASINNTNNKNIKHNSKTQDTLSPPSAVAMTMTMALLEVQQQQLLTVTVAII